MDLLIAEPELSGIIWGEVAEALLVLDPVFLEVHASITSLWGKTKCEWVVEKMVGQWSNYMSEPGSRSGTVKKCSKFGGVSSLERKKFFVSLPVSNLD